MVTVEKDQSGFGALEIILILAIVVVLGAVGWLAYRHHQRAEPYNGWGSFCSSYGDLCLQYPPSWRLTTSKIPTLEGSNQPSYRRTSFTTQADIKSPSGHMAIEYRPSCMDIVTTPAYVKPSFSDIVLSVSSPAATTDFKIVKSVETFSINGTLATVSENYYLTSNHNVKQFGIAVGARTSTVDNESQAAFFVNSKALHASEQQDNTQCLSASSSVDGTDFKNVAAAKSWLNSSEAMTAGQILDSVRYNN